MVSTEAMKLPPLNSLVVCHWSDVVGGINLHLSELKPEGCVTIGRLSRIEKDYIVLTSSIYEGNQSDPVVDGTAIPRGIVVKISTKISTVNCE